MSQISNFSEAVNNLTVYLEPYLESLDIDTSSHFECINPEHEDKDPSMSIIPGENLFHCFSCGVTGNIFKAAHFLEGKGISGHQFIMENLKYLADKFEVHLEEAPLSEDQIYIIETYRAYDAAVKYLGHASKKDSIFLEAIEKRGWNNESYENYNIGTVQNYAEYIAYLKSSGFTMSFLDEIDLTRKALFKESNLIFPIADRSGRAVGFASRKTNFKKGDTDAKYVNTSARCPIYHKSQRLFGLDRFTSLPAKEKVNFVYIFEGYSDVVTAYRHGINNAVAIGGTAFTQAHLETLKKSKIFKLVICLDGDKAGEEATKKSLDTLFKKNKEFTVKVITIPESQDPDEYIKTNGKDGFLELKQWSSFEWRLNKLDSTLTPDEVCRKMVPLILQEYSLIEQESMCKTLSNYTGIGFTTITSEVDQLKTDRSKEKDSAQKSIINTLLSSVKKDDEDIQIIFNKAQNDLHDVSRRYNADSFSEKACLMAIQVQKNAEENRSKDEMGFKLGKDLKTFEDALRGNWRTGTWITLGAEPNVGKSSFLCKLQFEIARQLENNACVIYHTIDDTFEQILPKFVAIAEASKSLTLGQITYPSFYSKSEGLKEKRDAGYDIVTDLISSGRLVIKDANDGTSLAFADNLISYYKKKYPDRNIVYVLDNFHKLPDFKGKDERIRFKELSKSIKLMSVRHRCSIISTVEYRKIQKGAEGGNADLAECLTGDTLVYEMGSNRQVRIDSIKVGDTVGTLREEDFKIVPRKVTKVWDKGVQQVYEVLLTNGSKVRTTMNHPFFGEKGWTKLSNLPEKAWIAVPKKLRQLSHDSKVTPDLALLLGYLAGDGNYVGTPRFTNSTKEYYEDVIRISESNFKVKVTSRDYLGSKELSIGKIKGFQKENPLTGWLRELGIWGQTGADKTIPECIFTGSNEVKKAYIQGLINTDGSIGLEKERFISFSNTSSFLIEGLRTLLLHFGIQCKYEYEAKTKVSVLSVKNGHINLFKKEIPLKGYKQERLEAINLDSKFDTCTGLVLSPLLTKELKEERTKKGLPVRLKNGFWIQKETINLSNARSYIKESKLSYLEKYVNGDVHWTQIKKITKLPKEQVWDLTVEDTHNFIANNIFCHNSGQLEYDANAIIHMHSDLHKKQEAATEIHHHDFKDGDGEKILPIVKFSFGKNKISGFKNALHFKFFPDCSDFSPVETGELLKIKNKSKESMKDNLSNYAGAYKEFVDIQKEKGLKEGWIFYEMKKKFDMDNNKTGEILKQLKSQKSLGDLI